MRQLLIVIAIISLSSCAAPATIPSGAPETVPPNHAAADNRSDARPNPLFPRISVNPNRSLGDPKATLAIVEFGDYQCPYCRAFHASTFRQLRSELIDTGKVRYFYKDFPLRSHPHAYAASITAYCAGAQGRYWEMQDHLYAKQAHLGAALYTELVALFELDAAKFDACRTSSAARYAVLRDFEDGRRIHITGTPSFVIGHIEGDRVVVERMATGTPVFESFAKEIEALARGEASPPAGSSAH